jgi:hypothetical protein
MILAGITVVIGVISMALNNDYNKKYSNHLMQLRVLFQGIALIILAIIVWLSA